MKPILIHCPTEESWAKTRKLLEDNGYGVSGNVCHAKSSTVDSDTIRVSSKTDLGHASKRYYKALAYKDHLLSSAETDWPFILQALDISSKPMNFYIKVPTKGLYEGVQALLLSRGYTWRSCNAYPWNPTIQALCVYPSEEKVIYHSSLGCMNDAVLFDAATEFGKLIEALDSIDRPARPEEKVLNWHIASHEVKLYTPGGVKVGCTAVSSGDFDKLVAERAAFLKEVADWDAKYAKK